MPLQLACPNCQMVVNVPEMFAAQRTLCPGCQAEMKPVTEDEEEPVVAEPIEPPRMVAVELEADAPPPRPTVVVPHAPPPKWKPTPVARAWITVARGLDLQRWGAVVVLVQAGGQLILLQLARDTSTWIGFVLTCLAAAAAGILFTTGRLCCYRVPPRTGARLGLGLAGAVAPIAAVLALAASPAYFVGPDDKVLPVLSALRGAALGSWLAAELMFLLAIARIMHFVKRPGLVLLSGMTAVAAALTAGLWIPLTLSGTNVWLAAFESALAGLCVLYLILLRAARGAVLTRTPADKDDAHVVGGVDRV